MEHKKRKQNDQENLVPEIVGGKEKLGYKQGLDFLGSIPVVQNCISERETVKLSPITALTQNSRVIDFIIGGYEQYVYDGATLRANLKLAILADGKAVGPARQSNDAQVESATPPDLVSVINSIGSTMFRRVMVWINDTEVFSSNTLHPYRSWIENKFAYSMENKYSVLRAMQGFANDNSREVDILENSGMFLRSEWTENGQVLHLSARLSHDAFNCGGKVWPPGTSVRVRLERASDEFCLMWDETNSTEIKKATPPSYTLDLRSIQLEIERFRLEQPAVSYISKLLSNQPARYYMKRVEMREQYMPQNSLEWTFDSIFGVTQVPLRLFFGLCPITAKNGTMTSNPLFFGHYDMTDICVKINEKPMQTVAIPGWKGTQMLSGYAATLKALRILDKPTTLDMTMDGWAEGPMTLFGFDLSKDGTDNTDPINGSVSINLRFGKATPVGLVAIFYGCYHGSLFIYSDKTVETYDTTVVSPSKRE